MSLWAERLRWRCGTWYWPPPVPEFPGAIDLEAGTCAGLTLGDRRLEVAARLGKPDYPRRFDHHPSVTYARFRLTVGFTRADRIEHFRLTCLELGEPPFNPPVVLPGGARIACAELTEALLREACGAPIGGFGPPAGACTIEWDRPGFRLYLDRLADGRVGGFGWTLPEGAVRGVAGVDWSP